MLAITVIISAMRLNKEFQETMFIFHLHLSKESTIALGRTQRKAEHLHADLFNLHRMITFMDSEKHD